MIIMGIDPGPTTSGYVVLEGCERDGCLDLSTARVIESAAAASTEDVIGEMNLRRFAAPTEFRDVACEWLTTYGSAVGASVLDTARVVGRYQEAAQRSGVRFALVKRPDVCMALCGCHATKSQVRHAVLETFAPTGGGATPQVGTKRQPGPLYGVRSHAWDAVAVAVAWTRGAGGER